MIDFADISRSRVVCVFLIVIIASDYGEEELNI